MSDTDDAVSFTEPVLHAELPADEPKSQPDTKPSVKPAAPSKDKYKPFHW